MASWQGSSNPVPILEKIYRDLHDIKLHLMPSYAEREGANEAFPAAAAAAAGAGAAAVRPLKMLSPEHKAKMLAAAAAAREAKKAAHGAFPAAAAAAGAAAAGAEAEWIRKNIGGKKHLWNPANNHLYLVEADGSQGAWAGLYNPETGKVNTSVPEPEHNGGSRKQKSTRRRSTKSRKTRRN